MLLVNVLLKYLIIRCGIYTNIFVKKMWVTFAFAKATYIFSAKKPFLALVSNVDIAPDKESNPTIVCVCYFVLLVSGNSQQAIFTE